jgi:hypothetical protein
MPQEWNLLLQALARGFTTRNGIVTRFRKSQYLYLNEDCGGERIEVK